MGGGGEETYEERKTADLWTASIPHMEKKFIAALFSQSEQALLIIKNTPQEWGKANT